MNTLKRILTGAVILLTGFISSSCEKELESYTEPSLEMQEEVTLSAEAQSAEVSLVSTYPWYAASNVDWIKVTKNRGQALLDEKVKFKVTANEDASPREGIIQIRLMDQMTVELKVVQQGR